MLGFTYNGVHSSEFGLVFKTVNRPILPETRRREITILGKSGTYDFSPTMHNNRYIDGTIQFLSSDFYELRKNARLLAAWLSPEDHARLYFDDEPDKYYLAKINIDVPLENLYTIGTTTVRFECQPYALYTIGTSEDLTWDTVLTWDTEYTWAGSDEYTFPVTSSPTSFSFNNPGTRKIDFHSPPGSKNNIVVTGSFSTLTIALNGYMLTYSEAVSSGTVTINNTDCKCLLGSTNKIAVLSGDLGNFLPVIPGENTITISGTGLNCSVQLDFIPLYI